MGHCGSLWVRRGSSKKSRKCGSFSELWVSVGQEGVVVRKVGSVGLLVNCGSLWVF